MRFSLSVLFGIWLWSGIFFLPQGEAQIPLREQVKEELRRELREELKKELREELIEELKEEEEIQQKIRAIQQEIQEYVIAPCRNQVFERISLFPNRQTWIRKAEKLFEEIEKGMLRVLLENHSNDKDVRMKAYFVLRQQCENSFGYQ